MEPGVYTSGPDRGPIIHLKSAILAIEAKYVMQQFTKVIRQQIDEDLRLVFERFDLRDFQFTVVENREAHTIEIKPIREIDRWALRGILLTNEEDITY
jgi:hypothetical protein